MFNDLANKEFRDAFVEESIRAGIAFQIRAIREKLKLSQPQLAERAKKQQSVISRLEDPNYGRYTIRTLLDLASAFDVALLVKFVPFGRLVVEQTDLSPEALAVPTYEEEKGALEEAAVRALAEARPQENANQPPRGSTSAAVVAMRSAQVDIFGAQVAIRVPEATKAMGATAARAFLAPAMMAGQKLKEFRI